jgi:hypothetical protein
MYFVNRSLPQAKQNEGFKGIITLGDRQSGKALSITLCESEETMRASEEEATGCAASCLLCATYR